MKYKVGDKVKYCSEICTVTKIIESQGKFKYRVASDAWFDIVNEEMIEGLVEDLLDNEMQKHQRICDEIMDIQGIEPIEAEMEQVIHCPEGYQFKDENGNVINATKIVLEKKKKEYPKTFEECVHVLEGENRMSLEQMNTFRKLIDARNAYWKIAGEEMGLEKPWEPDWKDDTTHKFTIHTIKDKIYRGVSLVKNYTFAFPTEEMRDEFKENFGPDIDVCKELL